MILLEHLSLRAALYAGGLQSGDHSDEDIRLPVVFAWSPRKALLLRPEYACLSLSEEDCLFIRLPILLDEINAALRDGRNGNPTADTIALTHIVGQFRWALNELGKDSISGNNTIASLRLNEIRRFSRKHWIGWFDLAFNIIEAGLCSTNVTASDELMCALSEIAGQIACVAAFEPFLHGAGLDVANTGPGNCRAALSYFLQPDGLDDIEYLTEVLRQDVWWPGMLKALVDSLTHIAESGASRAEAEYTMTRIQSMIGAVKRAGAFFDDLIGGIQLADLKDALISAEYALGTLIDTTIEIKREHERLKTAVQEGISHSNNTLR